MNEEQSRRGSLENYFFGRDHLGSVREVLKSVTGTNTPVARYDYDPYGKRLTQYQSSAYTGGCDLGFTGHVTAPSLVAGQTELVLTRYRAYDPNLGRWLSADPIGEAGGMNLYGCCYGNPLNLYDPDGMMPSAAWWGGFFDFDQGTLDALGVGAMATADGFIPFSDPFHLSGGYSGCENGVGFSKGAGAFSRDVAILAAGLPLKGSKGFVTPGAASGTNAARLVFRRIFQNVTLPWGIRTPVGTPFVNFAWRNTNKIAGILGRYWPYYSGSGAAVSDAMDLSSSRDCP